MAKNFRPDRRRTSLVLAAALLGSFGFIGQASAAVPTHDRVRVLESARVVEDAELTDQDGRPFRVSELQGRVALILFGFTNCPDVCPTAMENLRLLRESGNVDPAQIAFVMISVDGEHDTPEVMKAYLARFSPDFIGLTGKPSDVKALASRFSAAFFKGTPSANGHYSVSHSPQVFVMDMEGRLRAEFYSASIEAMAGVTLALLNEDR